MTGFAARDVLRVLLLTKTMHPGSHPAWRQATAPWALGAFCLRSYVESIPELAERVRIEIRSYPSDASDSLILEEVRAARPHLVGFTNQPWNYLDTLRVSRTIARLFPALILVHGGPMVISRRAYLEKVGRAVAVAVEGEAEETFAELLWHYVLGDRPLSAVAGIAFFDEQGELRESPPRSPPDLSKLPPVMTPQNLAEMGPNVLYETARGCPFRCSFCNWGSQRTKLRARSRAAIEHDLAAILATPGVDQIWLTDSGLDISTEHITFVADTIQRHRTTPVAVSGYVFLLHADLGYVARVIPSIGQLQVGLQTANEDSLSEIGRKALSVQRFDRILDAVLPHHPELRVDLIYGLPNIGPAELRESVRFLLRKGIWFFNLFRLVAIPGTELAENKAKYGIVADEEYPFTIYASEGCTADDVFEMQQFKANIDTLRYVIARGGYPEALAAGVDLVDFAAVLHVLVPSLNRLIPFGADFDWAPPPELVTALIEAVDRFTERPESREALKELLRSRLSPLAMGSPGPTADPTPRFLAPPPGQEAAAPPRSRSGSPPGPPSPVESPEPRERKRAEPVALRVHDGPRSWTLRIERAAPERSYFRVVGKHGLYYEAEGGAGGDRRVGAVLALLTQRLLRMVDAGVALEWPGDVAARLETLRIPGLTIEAVVAPAPDPPAPAPPRRLQIAGEPARGAPRG